MPKTSAGILPFRRRGDVGEVLIGHPGGPFWARKDDGAWSVIKGEYTDEDPLAAARREFREETGIEIPDGEAVELPKIVQKGGKVVTVFAVHTDVDAAGLDTAGFVSNTFETEWPPRSGRMQSFPEIDRIAWFSVAEARVKLLSAQTVVLDALPPIPGY
ncbi:NUDIX domain-containing protein [Rhodococcus sovatensis]|uniref:NUDIX domain-containing protein n=1 Tax=Rhodococcus sovatensis TaxID=1805840 RepID=A0ABZ2PKD7_9NOCA